MKIDILAFGAHPDDVELSAGGTLLQQIALGKKVGLVDLTRGELGTRGTPEIRTQEATQSAKLMGASLRVNLDFADGFFTHDREHLLAVVEIIRLTQPEIILANSLSDRHPDHGRAAKLVAEASFLAGLSKVETEWEGKKQSPHRPRIVYHYIQDHNLVADFVVDISAHIEKKIELIKSYKSQFYDPNSPEPNTPISSKDFWEFIFAKARTYGRPAGLEFAEGFNVTRTIAVDDLFKLI